MSCLAARSSGALIDTFNINQTTSNVIVLLRNLILLQIEVEINYSKFCDRNQVDYTRGTQLNTN